MQDILCNILLLYYSIMVYVRKNQRKTKSKRKQNISQTVNVIVNKQSRARRSKSVPIATSVIAQPQKVDNTNAILEAYSEKLKSGFEKQISDINNERKKEIENINQTISSLRKPQELKEEEEDDEPVGSLPARAVVGTLDAVYEGAKAFAPYVAPVASKAFDYAIAAPRALYDVGSSVKSYLSKKPVEPINQYTFNGFDGDIAPAKPTRIPRSNREPLPSFDFDTLRSSIYPEVDQLSSSESSAIADAIAAVPAAASAVAIPNVKISSKSQIGSAFDTQRYDDIVTFLRSKKTDLLSNGRSINTLRTYITSPQAKSLAKHLKLANNDRITVDQFIAQL